MPLIVTCFWARKPSGGFLGLEWSWGCGPSSEVLCHAGVAPFLGFRVTTPLLQVDFFFLGGWFYQLAAKVSRGTLLQSGFSPKGIPPPHGFPFVTTSVGVRPPLSPPFWLVFRASVRFSLFFFPDRRFCPSGRVQVLIGKLPSTEGVFLSTSCFFLNWF